MPGLSATVGEQIEALRRVAGERAVRLIRREPDPADFRWSWRTSPTGQVVHVPAQRAAIAPV